MTTAAFAQSTVASCRSAGRAAITSGVIGGFLGVAPLPIWTVLVGRKLLKMGRLETMGVTTEGAV